MPYSQNDGTIKSGDIVSEDARRWGVIDPVASGGGRTGAIVVDKAGMLSTNATVNYNYLDYWHVPDNEIVYNTPSDGSAPTKNPRQ